MYASRELRTLRFLYNSLQFLAAEQNPVRNKTWQYTLLGKKENNSAEKEGFLSIFFLLPFARNKKNGNIESRIQIGCAPCAMKPVFTLPAASKTLL